MTSFGTQGAGDGEFASPNDCFTDSRGRIHVVDSGNNRVQVFEKNSPPFASLKADVPIFGLTATLTSLSTDDEAVIENIWNFGDGTKGAGGTTEHAFPWEGTWMVTLTVKDAQGLSASAQQEITVTSPSELSFDLTEPYLAPGAQTDFFLTGAEGLDVEYLLEGPGTLNCQGYECAYTAPDDLGQYEQATITASLSEAPAISTSAVVYFLSRVLTAIVPDPETLTMAEGDQTTLAITAHYSDDTTEAVTEQVQWTIDPENLATVAGGVITAVEPGKGYYHGFVRGQGNLRAP